MTVSVTILDDVKKVIGINTESFDDELEILIGSAVSILNSVGACYGRMFLNGYTWDDIIRPIDPEEVRSLIIEFICLEVKYTFDPPSTAASIEALKKHLDELLFRIEWLSPDDKETDILMHHGIKGQKWGVRKKKSCYIV